MKHLRYRTIQIVLGAELLVGFLLSGCSFGGSEANSTATPAAGADGRVKLSMVLPDPGTLPEGANISDNPWINIVKDKANVDLEVKTENNFNALMYKGNLPDLVQWAGTIDTYGAARDGAFIDLKPYYDKSPALQKVVTPLMMEFAKDSVSGKYWRIPMPYDEGAHGAGIIARYDLVQKYNSGKWPESVEEWIGLLRKIKQAEPDSIPMTNLNGGDNEFNGGGIVFFNLFGANPYGFRIEGGKVIPNVVLPEYKAAVEIYRQLYAEGILDKEFATEKRIDMWNSKWDSKDVLFRWDNANQLLPAIASSPGYAQGNKRLAFAPDLTAYPSVLSDPRYAKGFMGTPITAQGIYISSKSKYPELAFQVIEAFASDELREAIRGKPAAPNNAWSRIYAMLIGSGNGQGGQQAAANQTGEADYIKLARDSMAQRQQDAEANGIGGLPGYLPPDAAAKKVHFSMELINQFTTEAIMDRITMDQFDQARKNWEKQYRSVIYDPMQSYLDANKEQLIKLGVKMAGW